MGRSCSTIAFLYATHVLRGPPFNLQEGGWSFCRGQTIYFNPARWRAENFKLYHMFIYGTVLEVLFISCRVCPKKYLFQKKLLTSAAPPPWRLNGGPLTVFTVCTL